MRLIINCDGGARGNPGPAAIGYVIKDKNKKILFKHGEYIGTATNNIAEYRAVISALEKALELGGDDLEFYIDSELVVKQINGLYKVKNKDLAEEFLKIYNLRSKFDSVVFHHVYREKNKEADAMVNKALDEKLKKQSN